MAESTRVCSKCGIEKPRSAFPDDKFRCRDCRNARLRASRRARAPQVECIQCGSTFPRFGTSLLCSERCKAARRRSLLGQPEPTEVRCVWCGTTFTQVRAYARFCSIKCMDAEKYNRMKRDVEYRTRRAAYDRQWRVANAVHIREQKRKRRAEYPEVARAKVQQYRATKRLASTVPFTVEQTRMKLQYWGNRCWMCGGPATDLDHVKPLSKQGPHMLANLRPACKPCNSSKNGNWFGPAHLDRFLRADLLP